MGEEIHPLVRAYRRAARLPLGDRLFSRAVCLRAPYFASIRPTLTELAHSRAVVALPKRRAVQNHIGTVHAIAMCNACELAAGMATEVTLRRDQRWIPKGMSVAYHAKAETDLTATAEIETVPEAGEDGAELIVPVLVHDTDNRDVMRADITMWVTRRQSH